MSFTSRASRWTDVSVISTAQLLGALGTYLVMVTQILVFEQRGASGLEVAALIMCETVPMVLLGKPIGALIDRIDSRLLLVAAGSAQALACLALTRTTSLVATLGVMLGLALASAVAMPTQRALVPAMVTRDDLPRASAIGQTAGSIGMMSGPALAGFLVGGIGSHAAFRSAALVFLITVVAALAVRTRRGGRAAQVAAVGTDQDAGRPSATIPAQSTNDSAWTLRSDSLLRVSIWSLAAVFAAASAVNVVLVFFVVGTLNGSPQQYGVIDAMWMVGVMIGAWLFGLGVRRRTGDLTIGQAMMGSIGMLCLSLVAVATAQAPWWVVPCYLLGGAANGAVHVCGSTLIGRRVPAAALGRAHTALAVRVQGAALVGYVAGGLLLAVAQPRWIVLGCGVAGLLVALTALPAVARSGRQGRSTEPEIAAVSKVAPWGSGTESVGTTGNPATTDGALAAATAAVEATSAVETTRADQPSGPR